MTSLENTLKKKLSWILVKSEWSLFWCQFSNFISMVLIQILFPEKCPALKSTFHSLNSLLFLLFYYCLTINSHFGFIKISNSFSMCYFTSNFFLFFIQPRFHHLWHQLIYCHYAQFHFFSCVLNPSHRNILYVYST